MTGGHADGQRKDTTETNGHPLLTTAEAAARLGVSVRQFARLCRHYGIEADGQTAGQVRSNLYSEAAIRFLLQETGKADHGRTDNGETDTAPDDRQAVQVVDAQAGTADLLRGAIDAALAPLVAELTAAREQAAQARAEAQAQAERAARAEAALEEARRQARRPRRWWQIW